MANKRTSSLSTDMLPALRALATDSAVKSATIILLVWGAINLGAWFIFGGENREFLSSLSDPSTGIYIIMYGAAGIGATMLLFGFLGATLRPLLTVLLSGLSLLVVGLWNILSDFIAMAALQPYGYTIESVSTFWVILGIVQVIWGTQKFREFGRVVKWKDAHVSELDKQTVKEIATSLTEEPENPETINNGHVKASIKKSGALGIEFLGGGTDEYSGQILNGKVIFVKKGLGDYFTIEKGAMRIGEFGGLGALTVRCEDGKTRTITLGGLSVFALKRWAEVPLNAKDISFLIQAKKATIELVAPLVNAESTELRAAAVEALGTIDNPDSHGLIISSLSDQGPAVRIAAVKSARALKMSDAVIQVAGLLRDNEKDVRKATAECLADIATADVASQLRDAIAVEVDGSIRKELRKALKKISR